jgi:multidrug efflux pump
VIGHCPLHKICTFVRAAPRAADYVLAGVGRGAGVPRYLFANLLGRVNVDSPKGSFDGPRNAYTIAANDQLFDATKYQSLILTQKNGVPIELSTLGKVVEGVENARLAGWAGTKPAVLVIIQKQAGANVIETVDRIKAVLPQIKRWIPSSIEISPISDRTQTIRAAFNDVQFSLLLSVALVVMVIFLFLRRFWPTFIACIAMPLAIAGTLGFMYLFNYSLDNLSLMAITICVGFVVDDAIVVIENVYRFIEHGDPPFQAALKGAKQIGFTVVSMSLSLVAVFIPLLFMGGLIGRLFHEFGVTLSLAILVSGVISLTLTPMLCSRFLKAERDYGPPGLFYRMSERSFNWVLRHYERSLKWVLKHQTATLVVTVATLVVTVLLYVVVPKGFFPVQDTGVILGVSEAPESISFTALSERQQALTRVILKDPDVASLSSFIGIDGTNMTPNSGRIQINLKPRAERRADATEIIRRIQPALQSVEGITLFMQPVQDLSIEDRVSTLWKSVGRGVVSVLGKQPEVHTAGMHCSTTHWIVP